LENNVDPLWYLADSMSLQDAAALIAGYDPNEIDICRNDSNFQQNYARLYPVEKALICAIRSRKLEANIVATGKYFHIRYVGDESEGYWEPVDEIALSGTTVNVDDLKKWLESRGINSGFFFSNVNNAPDFLDKNHKNYSPKLAAAISSWQAVSADSDLIKGTTVKQALLKWLRKNADKFGLTKEDGNPNEQGIEEIAKIANWDPKGGAPRTPE